jgi:hypothetical protein
LDLQKIVAELEQERDRLDRAINLLKGIGATKGGGSHRMKSGERRGSLSPEGRRRISEAMKKRWAERRKRAKSPA